VNHRSGVIFMDNRDINTARTYHESTKHSFESVRHGGHFLDWSNMPVPFKAYRNLEPLGLKVQLQPSGAAALQAIAAQAPGLKEVEREAIPDLRALMQALYFSAGITKRKSYPGGEIYFRAAACTGALYEFELYLVAGDLPSLEAGVYHWSPAENDLRRLRTGDFRGMLVDATAGEPAVALAPVTVICAGTYWRNAWKYQARTYRHFGWDNGTILANLLAEAAALGLPASVVMGFVDEEVNRLLGLNTEREVTFSLVPLGRGSAAPPPAPAAVPGLDLETMPLSRHEVDYPMMREMHGASSLAGQEEVAAWRQARWIRSASAPAGEPVSLRPLEDKEVPPDTIEEVILRRGSTREFAREPISYAHLSTMLDRATRGIPADFLQPPGNQWNDLYLIVNAVEGLLPGAYYYRREERQLELLKEGHFRDRAGYLGLEQELPADSSAAIFFLADLEAILKRYGNRGYRAVQLEAGLIGGKLYLAAYALRLGATGLTFYDDDVVGFFSPHARGKSAIFLVALGRSRRAVGRLFKLKTQG